jgi:hypothetical protein
MIKNLFLFLLLFLLANCASTGTALLGPLFTGAKTGSIYQASISYGSNQVLKQFKSSNNKTSNNEIDLIDNDLTTNHVDPFILTAFAVLKVEISDVLEPEPLP